MSSEQPTPNSAPPDDLPPVQPPSAGFLVQLFLIPGIIVAVIVVVWIMVDWLAHMETDPQKYVDGLRRDTPDRWQKAEQLADMLRSDRSNQLKGDAKLAKTLGDILVEAINEGRLDDESTSLRLYLCRALGQFNTPEGLPALIKAATTNRDPKELPVREAALDAIGMLTWNLEQSGLAGDGKHPPPHSKPPSEQLLSTLLTAARDAQPVIRLRAAFVLGIVGGDQAIDRLKKMLDDPNRDVTYNAAIGLARHGDTASIDTLLAMLDPKPLAEAPAGAPPPNSDGQNDPDRKTDPTVVILNGLRAISQLADANPTADLSRLQPAVDRLRDAGLPLSIRDMAMSVRGKLSKRSEAAVA
ncbi:MAG TPA: HEAT repeat domain-containing protein, partial [Pirellulales bacterium]|nr:HEAT repeat domain-containing protein [Pirellulales bacterium]